MNGRPGRWACGVVGVAVHLLPPGRRARYRQEFETEMYNVSTGERFRFACGVLSCALSLRAALVESPLEDGVEEKFGLWARLCCALNQHDWESRRTEDNEEYALCARCGRDDYQPPGSHAGLNGMTAGGGITF